MCDDLYEVIGCPKSASKEQILAEYRLKVLALHPDKVGGGGGGSEERLSEYEANKQFQQLQEVLVDPKKREHYDLWTLLGGRQIALKDWMDSQDKIRQTIHWGHRNDPPVREILGPKMGGMGTERKWSSDGNGWEPYVSSTTRAFRNYKI
uniref:J domain-containing protein n=1 Tax=Globodera pallida TaxID=36090 RepID=A0A183BWJ9_GLOPA